MTQRHSEQIKMGHVFPEEEAAAKKKAEEEAAAADEEAHASYMAC